jgi:hypothetical protein
MMSILEDRLKRSCNGFTNLDWPPPLELHALLKLRTGCHPFPSGFTLAAVWWVTGMLIPAPSTWMTGKGFPHLSLQLTLLLNTPLFPCVLSIFCFHLVLFSESWGNRTFSFPSTNRTPATNFQLSLIVTHPSSVG